MKANPIGPSVPLMMAMLETMMSRYLAGTISMPAGTATVNIDCATPLSACPPITTFMFFASAETMLPMMPIRAPARMNHFFPYLSEVAPMIGGRVTMQKIPVLAIHEADAASDGKSCTI